AVAYALLQSGTDRLTLCDSDRTRAEALARRLSARFGDNVTVCLSAEAALADADGIVNATPMGMQKYPGLPFAPELLQAWHWVADIVYFPAETALLALARS